MGCVDDSVTVPASSTLLTVMVTVMVSFAPDWVRGGDGPRM